MASTRKAATSSKDRAALDALAKEVGGKAQYEKGRVEYKVSGKGFKSTRYMGLDEEPNLGLPRTSAKDPRPYPTLDDPTGELGTAALAAKVPAANLQQSAAETPTMAPGAPPPVQTPAAAAPPKMGTLPPVPTTTGVSGNKYQQALSTLQQQGVPAPADPGQARLGVSQALGSLGPQGDVAVVDSLYAENPELQALTRMAADYFAPSNQRQSLLDDYKKMRRQSGLDDINEEIIDAETIIDGTEDDIRNEIQMAGGMGTESQVQAMSLARNKSLLKRYNNLVSMREQVTSELNMMVNLSAQDRQMAEQRFSTAMNLQMSLANFRQTALQNTRSQYQWMAQQMGADGLYNSLSSDPRQLAAAEKILGLSPGGMQQIAVASAQEKARKNAIEERQIRATESNAAATWANVALQREKMVLETVATQLKSQQAEEAAVAKADTVLGKVREANKLTSFMSTGFFGNITKGMGSSQAYNLNSTLDTIKANLAFGELQKMREASPTGGAVGNVTERELQLLANTAASLDIGQDAATLRNNLVQIQNQYTGVLNKMGYGVAPDGSIRPLQ